MLTFVLQIPFSMGFCVAFPSFPHLPVWSVSFVRLSFRSRLVGLQDQTGCGRWGLFTCWEQTIYLFIWLLFNFTDSSFRTATVLFDNNSLFLNLALAGTTLSRLRRKRKLQPHLIKSWQRCYSDRQVGLWCRKSSTDRFRALRGGKPVSLHMCKL